MEKFNTKYYKLKGSHFQVMISENMLMDVKIHNNGTYNLSIINPKLTNVKLGRRVTLQSLKKEKSKIKIDVDYTNTFFKYIEEISKSIGK